MNDQASASKIITFFVSIFMTISGPCPTLAPGCFGGQPDIVPHTKQKDVPRNTQIRITRKDVSSVRLIGPNNTSSSIHETYVGKGPSVARVLTAANQLQPGRYKFYATDPDILHEFTVGDESDVAPPQLEGAMSLESFHSYEPTRTCPKNIWIKISLKTPQDDLTPPIGFSYLIIMGESKREPWHNADLLVNSEVVTPETVSFRIGEADCGCIPRIPLQVGSQYRISVYAVDGAGHLSPTFLSSIIRIDPNNKK